MSEAERDAYEEAPIARHARLIAVARPTIDQIVNTGRRLALLRSALPAPTRCHMGSAADAITGNVGSGYGVWAMPMRKIRRSD